MAMGKRKRQRQPTTWVSATDFPMSASHPFYTRLNQLLGEHGFDDLAEAQCTAFYAETMGRLGLPAGDLFPTVYGFTADLERARIEFSEDFQTRSVMWE
jgi:hypothetical protein